MSAAAKIRGFLLQKPKPTQVRVTGDGEPEVIAVGRSYSRLAETIDALNVDLVECLDARDKVLRAMRLSDAETTSSDSPPLPAVLATDPNAAMLTHFGSLLANAYKHSTDVAFSKLVDITESLRSHTESLEHRLAQMEARARRSETELVESELEHAQELVEKANGESVGLGDQLMQSFIQGQLQRAGAQPEKNGAG